VLAIPPKRHQRKIATWLTDPEMDALIGACDPDSWTERRDRTLIVLAAQTGLRISEITSLATPTFTSASTRMSPA
jgi:integrase/recombinase XerD